uniref:Uncharacterized protein n=1 Tax=Panagrolaimus superbus TaxID=310955 RepID=A0A914XTN9_9BILA
MKQELHLTEETKFMFSSNSCIFLFYNFLRKRKRRVSFFVISLILFLGFFWFSKEKEIPVEYLHYKALLASSSNSNNSAAAATSACQVPQQNPWDSTILSYYSKPAPLKCKQFQENITHITNNGILEVCF